MDKKKMIGFAVMVGAQLVAMFIYAELKQRMPAEQGQ